MKKLLKPLYKKLSPILKWVDPFFDFKKFIFAFIRYLIFFKDWKKYSKMTNAEPITLKNIYPCIHDKTKFTSFDRHYIYHPAWAARILKETNPDVHIDISSSLHFCSIVSAFIPVKFYDFRPAKLELSNLTSEHADLTNLPFATNTIQSLSCMHTVEHVGLGRYGDPIDPDGDLKAINELKRVLAINGNLLFVVPIGKPKIMYNAHRIYSYDKIIDYFEYFKLLDFSLVPDDKDLWFINNATKEQSDTQNYGCGCFWFKKEIKS